jgi:pullulanase
MRGIVFTAFLLPSFAAAFCQTPWVAQNLPNGLEARQGVRLLSIAALTDHRLPVRDPNSGSPAAIWEDVPKEISEATPSRLQAFWIDPATILIPQENICPDGIYTLFSDKHAALQVTPKGIQGGISASLVPGIALTARQIERFPQLRSGYAVLSLSGTWTEDQAHQFLTGELIVSVQKADGSLQYATGVQTAGVLDELYAYSGTLGPVIRNSTISDSAWSDFPEDAAGFAKIKVWAPTAQDMHLRLFLEAAEISPSQVVPMHRHGGVWVAVIDRKWVGHYYLVDEVVYAPSARAVVQNIVTDPYSIDLSTNGAKSRLSDINAIENKPAAWDEDVSPHLSYSTDLSIYELHVRDFSIADETVPAAHRGTYLAFTDVKSDGMKHLRELAACGMKAVHLLPTFHFDGVDEDRTKWKITGDLTQYPSDSAQQQTAVAAVQSADGYNWGYAPIHYLAPEGAYATNPDNRIREYRAMVMALHRSGLRVIQDVVFNHTSGFGQELSSVLDKIVPNYYNRLDANGVLLTNTCCADTATEHLMMAKLQQDTVLWNAKYYKIDGFRFDLMSFTFIDNLRTIREALSALTLAKDGVDGSRIYIYGEGWDLGETAHNALGTNASQLNLHGTGIGSFNDRMRDGLRGGDNAGDPRVQGFATGLFTDPNSYTKDMMTESSQKAELLRREAWICAGLAGNLRNTRMTDGSGATVSASEIDYHGHATGYADTPAETVNYVSVHDDQSLFDAIQLKSSRQDNIQIRTRRQILAMSVVALGQGIPFFMGADDLLRSKDMDSDSYDSGDWFNHINWSGKTNNWGTGLPLVRHNQMRWQMEQPLLSDSSLKPAPEDIRLAETTFREFLKIRYSSVLFRLPTSREIGKHLHFLNVGLEHVPGTIVMMLDSGEGTNDDYKHVVVVFNATLSQQTITSVAFRKLPLKLHPVLRTSSDPVARKAKFDRVSGTVVIPPLTTAIFVSST